MKSPESRSGADLRLWAALLLVLTAVPGASQTPTPSPPDRIRLDTRIRTEALPLLVAMDHLGLGTEALRLGSWAGRHTDPLTLRPEGLLFQDESAESLHLSPEMARTLVRLNQWYQLTAPRDHPITHEQLRRGALRPAAIDSIRAIFERSISRGVEIDGTWVTPESGGEAVLDADLLLLEAVDPRWVLVEDLIHAAEDPGRVADLYEQRPLDFATVDSHGLLKVGIARFRLGARGAADEVRRALLTVARNAASTYSLAQKEQLAIVTGNDWRGRYVGGWHTHPPHEAGDGWAKGDVPSYEDMQNAIQYGQYLTLSFQPDGFDLYDAEPLADAGRVDLSLLKVIRYRSPAWRGDFLRLRPIRSTGSQVGKPR